MEVFLESTPENSFSSLLCIRKKVEELKFFFHIYDISCLKYLIFGRFGKHFCSFEAESE